MARAFEAYSAPIREERDRLLALIDAAAGSAAQPADLSRIESELRNLRQPLRRDLMRGVHDVLLALREGAPGASAGLRSFRREQLEANSERYGSHLYSASAEAATGVPEVAPAYLADSPAVRGFEVLNACFDAALARCPQLIVFGQDVGKLGDVNQGLAGLQDKYGELRVTDAGIREATLLGQGIGMALRGLRPIVEIQYLDYLLYALQLISDDLATLHYRTRGGQKAPVIIRTRGHRLEGIWHAGSPMAGIINLVRGIYVCVPRDMTRAAGFYNTLLRSDDSALIVEVLNGYRLKERLPANVAELTVPLGVPEVIREGRDVTVVTYGACCRIALEAAEQLATLGLEVELIDVQTLLPFDVRGLIGASIERTGRVVFLDEDVPGGATAYMMQQVLDAQGAYRWLDSPPRAVSAKAHRPAYGSDGDYFSKPNREQIVQAVYELMHEADPASYPPFW
jgi:pyruvate/2-oxoglutarate/acetoin dehydrogenase E1 component